MQAIKHCIKCVVLGDKGVGKMCVLRSYMTKEFPREYVPTVWDNTSTLCVVDGKSIELVLWCVESGRLDNIDTISRVEFPHTDVFVLLFSVDSPSSLERISDFWGLNYLSHYSTVPIILVANKIDLRCDQDTIDRMRERYNRGPISYEEGSEKAKEIKAACYVECSALTQKGLNEVFEEAIRAVIYPAEPLKEEKSSEEKKQEEKKESSRKTEATEQVDGFNPEELTPERGGTKVCVLL